MELSLTRKQVLKELLKFDSVDYVILTIYKEGLLVSLKMFTYEAIKLVQMLPNKSTFYDVQKNS